MVQWIPVVVTGDYDDRQAAANKAGCICYYEQHMNSYTTAAPQYGLVQVAHNASATSHAWATDLARRWQATTGLPTRKRQTANHARGNYNIALTAMPAILGEPGPISHRAFDRWMEGAGNRARLAADVAASIMVMFPDGGKVALSKGHLGKTSNPRDTGAGDSDPAGSPNDQTEGWFNADVIDRIAVYLAAGSVSGAPQPPAAPIPAPAPTPAPAPVMKRPVLRRGAKGAHVRTLQAALNARGARLAVDGDYGPKTAAAVKAWQRKAGLVQDQICGPKTWASLGL